MSFLLTPQKAQQDNPNGFMYCIFTHHGRTDELEGKKVAGMKECRYLSTLEEGEILYDYILKDKTSEEKGYKTVNLLSVSPKIGSGYIQQPKGEKSSEPGANLESTLGPEVQRLVNLIFEQANQALNEVLVAKVTTEGSLINGSPF